MSSIRYEVREHVAHITLDNPPVNAMSEAMIDELIAAFHRARDDDSARVVVLSSSSPKVFCGGLDLGRLLKSKASERHSLLEKLYPRLYDAQFHLGKPSIAAIGGAARGGGMTVAISCDLIIASSAATFGYPEIDVGVPPAIHFTHLPRIVGKYRAFELLFTGRAFSAQEAVELGLVSKVVAPNELMNEALKLAQTLAAKSPQVMRLARAAFMQANDSDFRRGVAGAVETFCNIAATEDANEGLSAFVEKREPVWGKK